MFASEPACDHPSRAAPRGAAAAGAVDRGPFAEVPLARLEHEIAELAAHIHAATCRWLCMVAEFDRREGWAKWGCRSCAEWVSWRCGLAPVAAREHVRVARRLEELPLIREAFARGGLSYSKVRALTRVGAVEREAELLELAQATTAAQLERLVRAYRGVVAVERAAAEGAHRDRYLEWDYEEDGFLTLRGRLPAEEGALIVAALEAARDALTADARGASAEGASRTLKEESCRRHLHRRCCARDEGLLALRRRPAGAGAKPPCAALAEDRRGERQGKGAA